MKLTTKQLSTLRTMYVYSDGHAVLIHQKDDNQAGRVEWAEVIEHLGPDCRFKGRIIFSSFYDFQNYGLARIIAGATRLEATKASIDFGSERTKQQGIQVGHLRVQTKDGSIDFHELPGLISGSYTLQEEHTTVWADLQEQYSWGGYNISKRYTKEDCKVAS